MDEHPGDTLGKRFLAFWGTIAAVLAFGILIYLVKGLFGPDSTDPLDGGVGAERLARKALVDKDQDAEATKYAFDKEKQLVTIPTKYAFPYAASVLSKQKAEKSKMPVPGAAPATGGTGAHDPNQSAFDKL